MQRYEYKVVPAPRKGQRGKGVKGTDAKFANALQLLMNDLGAKGWEYQRADTLPCEERVGLTGRTTTYQNMLIFRRALSAAADAAETAGAAATKPPEHRAANPEAAGTANAPVPDRIAPVTEGRTRPLGGTVRDHPGKTAGAPDVAAQ